MVIKTSYNFVLLFYIVSDRKLGLNIILVSYRRVNYEQKYGIGIISYRQLNQTCYRHPTGSKPDIAHACVGPTLSLIFCYQACAKRGRPRNGARAFHKLRRYHTRPLRLNWGPQKVHFGKRHFWDLNINVRIFKELPGAPFYILSFPLWYLKATQKTA